MIWITARITAAATAAVTAVRTTARTAIRITARTSIRTTAATTARIAARTTIAKFFRQAQETNTIKSYEKTDKPVRQKAVPGQGTAFLHIIRANQSNRQEIMWYVISAMQLEQYLDEDRWIYLVDMRDPDSYRRSHIQGAVNIPDEEFWDRIYELPVDRLIVLYCYRGPRSMLAAKHLAGYGYQVADVYGGFDAYRGRHRVG